MLKDLIVDSGTMQEAEVESILSDYVRYEVSPFSIVFTPAGMALPNKAKVLVYLVAILGWKFISEGEPKPDTRPSDLERALGMSGSTLRPILKRLSDSHLVTKEEGHYCIRFANLDAVKTEISVLSQKEPTQKRKQTQTLKSSRNSAKGKKKDTVKATDSKSSKTKGTRKKGPIRRKEVLKGLLAEGFFSEHRTLRQVEERLGEKAILLKVTDISGPIADLVRQDQLERKKIKIDKRMVWAYRAS